MDAPSDRPHLSSGGRFVAYRFQAPFTPFDQAGDGEAVDPIHLVDATTTTGAVRQIAWGLAIAIQISTTPPP